MNGLTERLSEDDRTLLAPHLEAVRLPVHMQLERTNRAIDFVYFPESGIASVVADGHGDRTIEIGLVGREGCTGVPVILGAGQAPHETFMQMGGAGKRIAVGRLRALMRDSETLRDLLTAYAHCFFVQTAQTALANGRSKLEERLTRWLLMAHDRADADKFAVTHEFLATMLGVRRAGVTVAINELQRQGVIKTNRGAIAIVDRAAMEKSANGAYGAAEAEYARLIGTR